MQKTTWGILSFDGVYKMNTEITNEGSWEGSEMRNARIERFLRLLPASIRNNIKPVIKHTSAGSSGEIISTNDKCFLFSEVEIFGEIKYSNPGEDEQYEYFTRAENRNFDNHKWLRSPFSASYGEIFCIVDNSGGSALGSPRYASGVALGFCI